MPKKKFKKTGRKSKYKPQFAADVGWMVVECGFVTKRGRIDWPKIAKIWKVSDSLIRRWLNRTDADYYKPQFAEAVALAIEAIRAGRIEKGLAEVAEPHEVVKKYREVKKTKLKPPPKSWNKDQLLSFARIRLGKKYSSNLTVHDLRLKIEVECEKQSGGKLVTVREVVTRELDVAAAKLVRMHTGPPEKRWTDKKEIEVKQKSLAETVADMMKDEETSGQSV